MRRLLIAATSAAIVVGTAGTALAVSGAVSSSKPTSTISGCLTKSRNLVDVHPNTASVTCPKGDKLLRWNATGPAGRSGGSGILSVTQASPVSTVIDGFVALTNIGGAIKTGMTELTKPINLQPGKTYQININGVFTRVGDNVDALVGDSNPDTYGTLALWADYNHDGQYEYATEGLGTCETAAIPKDSEVGHTIQASCSMDVVVTIPASATAPVPLGLGGFGYDSNAGSYGTGPDADGNPFFLVAPQMSVEQLNAG